MGHRQVGPDGARARYAFIALVGPNDPVVKNVRDDKSELILARIAIRRPVCRLVDAETA